MTLREQLIQDLRTVGPWSPEEWHAEQMTRHRFFPNSENPPTLTLVQATFKSMADNGEATYAAGKYYYVRPKFKPERRLFE